MAPYIPFTKDVELNSDLTALTNGTDLDNGLEIPGYPHLNLNDPTKLAHHVTKELYHPDLATLSPKLWMMSKQSSTNISPLTRQAIKGRTLLLTEEPKLHLTWTDKTIFLKPLPHLLLSHAFYTHLLSPTSPLAPHTDLPTLHSWVLGFLRTYSHLITHESDFRLAQTAHLLPDTISWRQWCFFSAQISGIPDEAVCMRYHYGEIRLARLNFYSKIFIRGRRRAYMEVSREYSAYFARFFAPLAFVLGVLSVFLSALSARFSVGQVLVDGRPLGVEHGLLEFARGFTVSVLVVMASIWLGLLLLLVYKCAKEWRFAIKDKRRKDKERAKALSDVMG